ncbi:MAG: hypothetical protein ACK54H_12220 [Phycisphaerales bacterium]
MMNRISTAFMISLIAGGIVAATPAFAQNALGDGRGLEKDMRRNGTGNTPRKSFREEVERRNALVTGEIGGGKAFRGNAGYRGATDFRGVTAGDSTFAFRRDSMSARTVTNAVRGGDSLRMQYTYAIGNVRVIDRTDGGGFGGSYSLAAPARSIVDRRGLVTQDKGAMRMTSLFAANRDLRPTFIADVRTPSGAIDSVAASQLLGVKSIPAEEKYRTNRQDLSASVRSEYRSAYEGVRNRLDLFAGQRVDAETKSEAPKSDDAAKTEEAPQKEWQRKLDELKPKISSGGESKSEATKGENAARKPTEYVPGSWRDKTESERKNEDSSLELDARTLEIIRAAGGVVSNLGFGEGIEGDPYQAHMAAGQTLLAGAKYFDAEERFSRALAYKPGEPMALVGRIHAQIGAGLHLSAAINVQDFFSNNPELIAVRYAGQAGLPADRLASQRDVLRERATNAPVGSVTARDSSLLWAYLSYQSGDIEDAARALDIFMREASSRDTNLGLLLRELWSKTPASPLQPIEPPPASTPETPAK